MKRKIRKTLKMAMFAVRGRKHVYCMYLIYRVMGRNETWRLPILTI